MCVCVCVCVYVYIHIILCVFSVTRRRALPVSGMCVHEHMKNVCFTCRRVRNKSFFATRYRLFFRRLFTLMKNLCRKYRRVLY